MVTEAKPHVFLSHVREDAARVERLAAELEARGIATWVDRHKIRPGERWEKAIEDAVRSGAFFVACFSRAYAGKASSYMNEELHLASKEVRRKPFNASWFIPVRLDDCEIPDWPIGPGLSIHSFQWLDVFPDWANSVERLAEAIGPSARPDHLREPFSVFQDIDAPWSPELVVIPPGEFMMGSTEAERRWIMGLFDGCTPEVLEIIDKQFVRPETPRHQVRIKSSFAVGRYPVTFEEYDRFADVVGRELPGDEGWGRGRLPVINVSWEEAQAYAAWLSKETGRSYRLLSEAEWEYAARAGTTTLCSWGDDSKAKNVNYDQSVDKTTEVGSYPPNRWGLYDMHGNVGEWIEDCWNDSYEGAPEDGSAWTRGDFGRRVRRGAGRSRLDLRSARGGHRIDDRSNRVGFRIARTLR